MAEQKLDKVMKEVVCSLLSEHPNISTVARMCGMHPQTIYKHMRADEEFEKEAREAMEVGSDIFEEEAIRRGVHGVDKPIVFKGEIMTDSDGKLLTVKEYSDSLLQTLLKAKKPKQYNPGAKVNIGEGERVSLVLNLGSGE